jgi:hypothetical protein
MKTIKQFSFFILILIAATSCIEEFNIRGNGVEASQTRTVPAFNKVKTSGNFDVHITKGDALEVVLNAEENILPYIETSVSDKTLFIDIHGVNNVNNRLPMNVYITVPELLSAKQSGSGTITTGYFSGDKMEFSISGSGSISTAVDANLIEASISGSGWMIITGDANNSNLSISGSGNIDSSELRVNDCNAQIAGSGNLQINASQSIYAKISGSGNVYYSGNPVLELNLSGSGKVIHQN